MLSKINSYFHVIIIDLSKMESSSVLICPNISVKIYQCEYSTIKQNDHRHDQEVVSFFAFRCEEIPSLDVKSSVTETNILVTSICDSLSHMWNVLLVTTPDCFFYYFQISQNQTFREIVCSLFICATPGDFNMSFIHIFPKEMPLSIKELGVFRETVVCSKEVG